MLALNIIILFIVATLGLPIASLAYRKRQWALWVWLPGIAVVGYAIVLLFLIAKMPGQTGWFGEALAALILVAARVIVVGLVVLIIAAIPRDDAWNLKAVLGGIFVCLAVVAAYIVVAAVHGRRQILVRVLDTQGSPVESLVMDFHLNEEPLPPFAHECATAGA